MKKILVVLILFTVVLTLSSCEEASILTCGEGTTLEGEVCVAIEETKDELEDVVVDTSVVCENTTGLHTVSGGSPSTISEWLNWNFIGGHLVTDPDNAWIIDYDAAQFNVHTIAEPWEGSFTQSGMFLEKGCEYTFTFTLRTQANSMKENVIVFGETTTGTSFFEETVDLETYSQTYRFTVVPEESNYVSTGVYFAGSRGLVVIENVQIERNPIGTYSE